MNPLDLQDTGERILGRILRRQAEKIGDADFLVADEVHYPYGRANELANQYAAGLRAAGGGSRGSPAQSLIIPAANRRKPSR